MIQTLLIFIVWLLLFAQANEANATRYWAATNGSDANACAAVDGSADPGTYRTISGAVSCATQSGDEVYIKPGTYTTTTAYINNPASGITIRGSDAATANWPILRPATQVNSWRIVDFTANRSNITFKYLFLDLDAATVSDGTSGGCFIAGGGTQTNIVMEDFRCRGPQGLSGRSNGIRWNNSSSNITVRRGKIERWVAPSSPWSHGIYFAAHDSVIENNEISGYNGNCIQVFLTGGTVTNLTFRNNICRDQVDAGNAGGGGVYVGNGSGHVFHNNLIYNTVRGFQLNGTNPKVWNNTIVPEATASIPVGTIGIQLISVSGCEVRNNLVLLADTTIQSGCTASNNLTSGTASNIFTNYTAGNFSLKSTATGAIDQGTNVGLECNGTCDIGAYHTFQSGITASAAGQNIDVTLPINIQANLPIRLNSVAPGDFALSDGRTVTGVQRLSGSSSILRLTYTGTCTGGTLNYTPPANGVTDGAKIGNLEVGQPLFALSGLAITNNCGTVTPTEFFASTGGSGTTCSSGSPCTLATLITKAAPGVMLWLNDGTHSCSGTCVNLTVSGTASQPITLKAVNPGLALVQGDGTSGEVLRSSASWWIIEGIRWENVDNAAYTGSDAGVVRFLSTADDNIFRKNIVRKPNRYGNNALLMVEGKRNLIEENAGLLFHRNGFMSFGTGASNNVFRLNYAGQTASNLAGTGQPNDGYVAYDSPNNIWESNIFESFLGASGGGEGFTAWGAGNKYYGNICIGAENNCMSLVSAASVTTGASGYVVRDFAATGEQAYGIFTRSPINADIQNVTVHTSNIPDRGFIANNGDSAGTTSLTLRNGMFIDTSGVFADPIDTVTISHSQEWGTASAWGTGTSGRTDSPPTSPGDVDPTFGDCRVNVPSSSPFSGVGFGGGDIGANAIWVYRNGVRTSERMFDHTLTGADRGQALHGPAVIAGVNDSSTGLVRETVHQRIGFGTDSCAFPTGYGDSGVASPIIDYDFTDGAGVTVTDNSGNANHGTLASGSTLPSWILGGGISFDPAVNDRVEVPFGMGIDPTTQSLTYCIGLRPQPGRAASIQHVLGWAEGTNQRLNIQQHNGSWKQSVQVGVAGGSSEFAVQEANTHICQRLDSSTNMAHLFVNGVKGNTADTAKSYTSFTLASNLDIGRSQGAGSVWSGVDSFRFRLWNSALSDADIVTEFETWQEPPPPPTGHVVAQVAYQFYLLRQFNDSLIKLPKQAVGAVSLPISVPADAVFVVDVQLDCTAGPCPAFASVLEHDIDGAGVWTVVPDSGDPSINFYGTANTDPKIPSGAPSCPLVGTNTCVAGGTQRTAAAVPVVEMAEDTSVVLRYIVRAPAVQKSLRLRLRNQDGTVFPVAQDAYATVTTVDNYAGVGL